MLQVTAPNPPVRCNVVEYAVPAVPVGNDALVTASRELIVICTGVGGLLAAKLSCTVTLNVATPEVGAVGVPVITPVELLSESPAGSPVAAQLEYGGVPPVADSAEE